MSIFVESERNLREETRKKKKKMGYVLRVRLASFFGGAAIASVIGFSVLYNDYMVAHKSILQQAKSFHDFMDKRISVLESLRQREVLQVAEATD